MTGTPAVGPSAPRPELLALRKGPVLA